MIDINFLFKITQGVYFLGASNQGKLVGSCIDAVMTAEVDPCQLILSINEHSFTGKTILETKKLSLSILSQETPIELIKTFGFSSSKENPKWDSTPHKLINGLPVYLNSLGCLTACVDYHYQLSHHHVIICSITETESLSSSVPLTYAFYQEKIKPRLLSQTSTSEWVCGLCGYVYSGEIPFEEQPDSYVCPVCCQPKSVFIKR